MYYGARYYDYILGRFISADTIIPNPYNPQALNRYSYVYNNPLKYTDPTGHCPWCAGAIGGAIIGGGLEWVSQAASNWQSGMSLSDALLNVDAGKIAGAAIGGAIVGGTFGAVGAGGIVTAGLGKMVVSGALANLAAGQASSLVTATWNEAADWFKNGGNLSAADILRSAGAAGFLDPSTMVIDTTSGAFAGAVSYSAAAALTKAFQGSGLLGISSTINDPTQTIRITFDGAYYTLSREGISVQLTEGMLKGYLRVAAQRGLDAAARWLYNQLSGKAEDYFEEQRGSWDSGRVTDCPI